MLHVYSSEKRLIIEHIYTTIYLEYSIPLHLAPYDMQFLDILDLIIYLDGLKNLDNR